MKTMLPDELAVASCDSEAVARPLEGAVQALEAEQEASFEQVFERYHPMVYNLTYRILGDREEALDVSQEVFICVYRKLHRFRWESSLKTWIYRIALNRASNRFRWWKRLKRYGTISLDGWAVPEEKRSLAKSLAAPGRSPEDKVLERERGAEIGRALTRLPIQQRVAVIMRDIEGLSYEEIASALQVSLGTVKSRISRGREELKRRLNGVLG